MPTRFFTLSPCHLVTLSSLPLLLAASPPLDPALTPFVTNGTLFIAKADTTRLDTNALDLLSTQHPALSTSFLPRFRAAGGRLIYAVAFLGDLDAIPGVLIVPLDDRTDAKAISSLLTHDGQLSGVEAIVLHNAVVFGLTMQVEKMKLARPVVRPLFADGLAALPDAPIKIVFSPSDALRIAGGELFPDPLPDAAGGAAPAVLINDLDFIALALTPAKSSTATLLIQCHDPTGVPDFTDLLSALTDTFLRQTGRANLKTALQPTTQGPRLSLYLNPQAIGTLTPWIDSSITTALTPSTQP
jgi:hypothetical protein